MIKIIRVFKASEVKALAFILLAISLVSCATYQGKVDLARESMKEGKLAQAAELLKTDAMLEGKDQLVYLYDYGMALQALGEYKTSIEILLKADHMAEVKDYHSISKQTAAVLWNEEQGQYKGEDYEKVLVNAVLAINFLMLDQLDEAMIEARRINEKLEHYRIDAKKNYTQNEFAVYLSALMWEADHKWDDAYIAYEKTYSLNPNIPYLKTDLIRSAIKAQRMATARKWQKQFSIQPKKEWTDRSQGEVVLIVQQGWAPRKFPDPSFHRVPKLYPVESMTKKVRLKVQDNLVEESQVIHSVEVVAMKTLNDQYKALVAKRLAAIAAKEVVADQVRQQNENLGLLLTLVMRAADRADLRQWSTLPETFQIARVNLKPGKYTISALGINEYGAETGEVMQDREIEVRPGKKSFLYWRSFY